MKKFIALCFLFLIYLSGNAQDVTYDTTYQVTYENGVKDSVIIITKRVAVKEMVYIVDSTHTSKWAVDFFLTPFNTNLNSSSRQFSLSERTGTNKLNHQYGQSIGTNLYYHKGNWEWRAGVQFSRFKTHIKSNRTNKNEYSKTYIEDDTLDVYYSIDEFDDTTYFYIIEPTQVTKTQTDYINQSDKTSFTTFYVEFSLQGGYRKKINNWNVYFFAGPVVGFLISSKGHSYNDRGEDVNVKSINLTTPMVNLQFNCQLAYDYSKSVQLYIEPYYQKYLFTANNNTNSWLLKRDLLGAKMGLKIFL